VLTVPKYLRGSQKIKRIVLEDGIARQGRGFAEIYTSKGGMMELFDLTDKVAIVTGASRGLGKSIAIGLAQAGSHLVLSSRNQSACTAVAKEVEALGQKALAVACDMGSWSDIDTLVEMTYERFGRCDVLVNNAGVAHAAMPLSQMTESFFDKIQAINLKGPMHLAGLLAPRMGEAGGGAIINIVSTAAIEPVGYMAAYSASKAALRALTRVMAEEWAPLGVRVNAIAPGTFLTDMVEELEEKIPGFLEQAAGKTLLKRIADPKEIFGPVLFLASEASSYMTGQTLAVCGGVIKS
jgi:NAD(P)-dependent dehydrogenase (short-subunit alcohol dehydrogenase family)